MNKEILRLAIPNIISNISIPLLSSVDTMLMGHLSAQELGAVGIASTIFNFLYWNFGFLRMGTTGMTAQAVGRSDEYEIASMLQKSLLFALIISLVLIILMVPIINVSSVLMNVRVDQQSFVYQYFYVRIWAAPASLGLYALLGWYFGMQNAKIPLILTVAINSLNIILSYYLVRVLDFGIRGVAIGTVIGQYFGLALAFIFIFIRYKKYIKTIPIKELVSWKNLSRFFNINRDIFLRTIMLSFAFAFLYSQSSLYGEIVLAANVVLLQFLNWMSYGIDGFAFAAESLVGKYFGKGNPEKTMKMIKLVFIWGLGLAAAYSAIYWIFGSQIINFFTNQEDVISMANQLLVWVILLPIISFACYIWDGVYIGLTASKAMRNTMFFAFIIYMGVYYGLPGLKGRNLIWVALFVFLAARGLIQTYLFYKKGLSISE